MNVLRQELRAHKKGLFFWSLGMVFLVLSGVAKFYGYSSSGTSNINQVLSMFPHTMQVLFGLNGFDLSQPSGVYGILFMYVAVTAAIHAVLLGTDLVSKEERDKTAEFVFAKPVSRSGVLNQKLLAGLIHIVILNLVTLVSALTIVSYYGKTYAATGDIVLLSVGLFLLQLLFLLLGGAVAAITKKPRIASGLASSIMLGTFILYFLINLSGNVDFLNFLTPFKYFDARTVLAHGSLDTAYIALSVGLFSVMLALIYSVYKKRDLTLA